MSKRKLREGEGQFDESFVILALDAAHAIEGDFGVIMALSDRDASDGRRSAEWLSRVTGCIDAAAI